MMKLWQIIAATIIFKSADFAFTAAFLLPPTHKFPPILMLGCWLVGSIVVWIVCGVFGGAVKADGWGDGLSRIPPPPPRPTPRPAPFRPHRAPPSRDD